MVRIEGMDTELYDDEEISEIEVEGVAANDLRDIESRPVEDFEEDDYLEEDLYDDGVATIEAEETSYDLDDSQLETERSMEGSEL